jgi:hypothetical protein
MALRAIQLLADAVGHKSAPLKASNEADAAYFHPSIQTPGLWGRSKATSAAGLGLFPSQDLILTMTHVFTYQFEKHFQRIQVKAGTQDPALERGIELTKIIFPTKQVTE